LNNLNNWLVEGSILRIKVHYTWIPVFILITTVVTLQFAEEYSLLMRMLFGAFVSLLFFATLALRELVLGMFAFRKEKRVKKMTLFIFGGVYQDSADKFYSTHPPLLYLSRYLSNFLLAAIFYGLYATFVDAGIYGLAGIAELLAYIFFLFFLVHFIPVYPLDGGEILRLIIWRKTRDYYRATRIVSLMGWAAGLLFIFAGVMLFIITRHWTIDLLIVLIGLTIYIAAGYTRRQMNIYEVLKTIKAEDVMTGEFPQISETAIIRQVIRQFVLLKGCHFVLVVEGNRLRGILTLKQIKSALRKRKADSPVSEFMTPYAQIRIAYRHQAANELYGDMYQLNIEYIPVLEDSKVVGVVTMSALINLARVRSGFGI
jgi:CBS domain-containing protein